MKRTTATHVAWALGLSLLAACGGATGASVGSDAGPSHEAGGDPQQTTRCGGSGEACCNGTACNAGLTCGAGTCSGARVTCGGGAGSGSSQGPRGRKPGS